MNTAKHPASAFGRVAFLLIAVLLAGCSGTSKTTMTQKLAVDPSELVVREANIEVKSRRDVKDVAVKKFEDLIMEEAAQYTGGVIPVALDIKLLDYRAVTRANRFWTGWFSGRSRITVQVDVKDLRTNQRIGNFVVAYKAGNAGPAGFFYREYRANMEHVAKLIIQALYNPAKRAKTSGRS